MAANFARRLGRARVRSVFARRCLCLLCLLGPTFPGCGAPLRGAKAGSPAVCIRRGRPGATSPRPRSPPSPSPPATEAPRPASPRLRLCPHTHRPRPGPGPCPPASLGVCTSLRAAPAGSEARAPASRPRCPPPAAAHALRPPARPAACAAPGLAPRASCGGGGAGRRRAQPGREARSGGQRHRLRRRGWLAGWLAGGEERTLEEETPEPGRQGCNEHWALSS